MIRKIDLVQTRALAVSFNQPEERLSAATRRIRHLAPESSSLSKVERSLRWWQSIGAELERRMAILGVPISRSAGAEWHQGPPLAEHLEKPSAAAAFFAGLSPGQAEMLAERYPRLIGPVDGVPLDLRYRANHILALQYLEDLHHQSEDPGTSFDGRPFLLPRTEPGEPWEWFTSRSANLDRRIADAEQWSDPQRQLLVFDPRRDGLIVEVFGRLQSAQHGAVVVPGIGNELAGYEEGLRASVATLHDSLDYPAVATIGWLGYDAPDNLLDAALSDPTDAAVSLSRFFAGLEHTVDRDVHSTVIGHSYGSVVTGAAARAGVRVDEVVLVGSPGVGAGHISELGLPATTRVWASRAGADPIRFARGVECLTFTSICYPSADRLFFGTDPVDPSFGAIEFAADEATTRTAHSSYFTTDSLSVRNLGFIILGQGHRATRPAPQIPDVNE